MAINPGFPDEALKSAEKTSFLKKGCFFNSVVTGNETWANTEDKNWSKEWHHINLPQSKNVLTCSKWMVNPKGCGYKRQGYTRCHF